MPPTPKITPPVQQITPPQDQAPVNEALVNQEVKSVKIQPPQPGFGAYVAEFFKDNSYAQEKEKGDKGVYFTPAVKPTDLLKQYEANRAANSGWPVAANSVEEKLVGKKHDQFQAEGPAAKRQRTGPGGS
jgi:hypothetical protein